MSEQVSEATESKETPTDTEVKDASTETDTGELLYGKEAGSEEATEGKSEESVETKDTESKEAADEKPEKVDEESGKPGDESKEAKADDVSVTLPEDSLLDESRVEETLAFAKEQKLSNTQAQAILDRESNAVAAHVQAQKEQSDVKIESWVEDLKIDKEFGGEKFTQTSEQAHRVMKRFANPEFMTYLNESGLGNYPDLVKTFARIGKVMSEDQLVLPGETKSQPKSLEDVFYKAI